MCYDPTDGELINNTINFFKTYLNNELKAASFKACYLLPGKKQLPHGLMPAVIVKFVYSGEKKLGLQSTKTAQRAEKPSQW